LHQKIFDLSQRQRAGDRSLDGLLGRLLDEMDERARRADEETYETTNEGGAI
jgi:hypothetical protein